MNPPPHPPTDDPDDPFVGAVLRERARLGVHERDEELVDRILTATVATATVERSPTSSVRPSSATIERSAARRSWIAATASAAALVALALLALESFTVDEPPRRAGNELHFVVRAPSETAATAAPAAGEAEERHPPFARARPYDGTVSVASPHPEGASSPVMSERSFPLLTSFDRSLDALPDRPPRHERFRIEADRTERVRGRLVYAGDVRVTHDRFSIEADEVTVPAPDADSDPGVPALVATGVTLIQETPSRTARAERLEFDPVAGAFLLTGVKRFDTAEGDLDGFEPETRLVITADSFAIRTDPTERWGASGAAASSAPIRPIEKPVNKD